VKDLPGVVIDANVLAQAPVRDTLLRLAERATFFRPLWSEQIMAEMRRTLEGKFGIARKRVLHLESKLHEHFPEAWVMDFEHLIPRMKNDGPDRHVLAAAVHAQASLITTYNLRHFSLAATRPWGVTALGPSALLKNWYSLHPELMIQVLHEQASDIRRTFAHQLRVLHLAVPSFVEAIRHDTETPI